jgi:hypothetical protein
MQLPSKNTSILSRCVNMKPSDAPDHKEKSTYSNRYSPESLSRSADPWAQHRNLAFCCTTYSGSLQVAARES